MQNLTALQQVAYEKVQDSFPLRQPTAFSVSSESFFFSDPDRHILLNGHRFLYYYVVVDGMCSVNLAF